ncbi:MULTISPECIES: MarR family winged helix-turn-helix transcriptional regulator [Mammaliicoccus]|uniref:MarR family transcriptional regulator n=2 Tax=Mammaliicoccus fleurettii TaxID=150056 RepID=A0ABS5MJJ2_9STAP|nr:MULTISPECIES: MarR family transcriptional regulator [Mammaliicoccus]HCN61214.1 MarR family transcriptional regulator [Staphylococcus sp.]MBL0846574.1 MarR family transcriptional regulator [Mammaliicoccus fleurettii]MBO3062946.1 MarR family transcriptional regulator [Mammaliicoccus fleurettii]MBS3671015.1 MarR family transcriptional regulator [Mammaliicoccus fleurettii]MBS3696074.1 MarR family transcriptional regulator [Mammaliicoccus fleurettii]
MEEITKQIEYSLRHIVDRTKLRSRGQLKVYDISPPQFIALQWLNEHQQLTIGELSKRLYLAYSTTTDIIDKLEQKELVLRIQSEEDKRVFHVKLLEKGTALIDEVVYARQSYTEDLLSVMNEEDKIKFNEALEIMLKRMRSEDK